MSSVEGFISSSPVSLSLVANSLDLMRKNHPTGHFGEYGTEVGLLFRGECDIKSNPNICSEIIEYGGEIFTKVLTRISNRKPAIPTVNQT